MTPPLPPRHPRGQERPLRAVALVLLLVGAGLAAAYAVSERVDPVYRDVRVGRARFAAKAADVEAVVLGNSHGGAIDFRTLGLHGLHGWLAGADYYEVLHVLREARPALPRLRYVFVPVSPITYDNASSPARFERRKEVYVATGNYRPMAGDWHLAFRALLDPVVRTDNWEGVARRLQAALSRASRPAPSRAHRAERRAARDTTRREGAPATTPEALERLSAQRAKHHRVLEMASRAHDPALCEHARATLRAIAEAAAPARLILFTPPYSQAYNRRLDPSLGCGLTRFAAALAAEASHVSYFDDRALPEFTDASGYFRDGDHMNAEGGRVYSARLAARLGLDPRAARSHAPIAEAP